MMLRPLVRTSVIAACRSGLSTSTTPPHLAPPLSQPKPRSPIRSLSCCSMRKLTSWSSSPNRTSKLDHGAVDQLHSNRFEPDNVLCGIHRLIETAEMAGTDRAAAEHRRQLQFDTGGKAERALAADQYMRKVDIVLARHKCVEIVTADPALHFRKPRGDLFGLARADRQQISREWPQRRRHILEIAADAAEMGE